MCVLSQMGNGVDEEWNRGLVSVVWCMHDQSLLSNKGRTLCLLNLLTTHSTRPDDECFFLVWRQTSFSIYSISIAQTPQMVQAIIKGICELVPYVCIGTICFFQSLKIQATTAIVEKKRSGLFIPLQRLFPLQRSFAVSKHGTQHIPSPSFNFCNRLKLRHLEQKFVIPIT